MERKTPLYETHRAAGGRIVPFAGWLLPVQYGTGVIAEHLAVRRQAGLFDVSHMGEFTLAGADALANLNRLLTNDFTNLSIGQVRYTAMCTETGGVVDDLVVCRLGEAVYLLVVNASNRDKDAAHIQAHLSGDCRFTDRSDEIALLALQGPAAPAILQKLAREADIPKKYYWLSSRVKAAGVETIVSRTGYTGELGYELYCAPLDAPALWDALLEAGAAEGLVPCGLGARYAAAGSRHAALWARDGRNRQPAGSRPGLCCQARKRGLYRKGCPACGQAAKTYPRRACGDWARHCA